ncbi:hypothetical protein BH11PSE4_BH11PSE4_40520 [soil metagenome]
MLRGCIAAQHFSDCASVSLRARPGARNIHWNFTMSNAPNQKGPNTKKKQKCKNCEGKGLLKKGDKVVTCQRCKWTGLRESLSPALVGNVQAGAAGLAMYGIAVVALQPAFGTGEAHLARIQ